MAKWNGLKKISLNQKGQFAIEAILLMSVLVGTFLVFSRTMQENKVIQKLFDKPMKSLSNMTTYGTWKEDCQGFGKSKQKLNLANCHPNSINRGLSSNPN